MTGLDLAYERRGDSIVVRLSGEVDLANSALLSEVLRSHVENTTFALALDLSETRYFDSSGIQLLFELAERLRSRRQELVVVVRSGSLVADVIELVRMDSVAIVAAAVDEGLSRVRVKPRPD